MAAVVHSLQADDTAAQTANEFLKKAKEALSKGDTKEALEFAGQAIALLDAMNPDALIVRTNAKRVQAGRVFDGSYVAGLSADAVPGGSGDVPPGG